MRRLLALVLTTVLVLAGCTREPPAPDGFVDPTTWSRRAADYLSTATRDNPSHLDGLVARLVNGSLAPGDLTVDMLEPELTKIVTMQDTSDFDLMRVWLVREQYGDRLRPEVGEALTQALTGFRYWYTDPLEANTIDNKWFWSENHRIIVHTLEYLAGRSLPTSTFTITGKPGTEHARRGRQRILAWMDEKVRYGFSEWHSDVYYAEDLQPLLLLSEYAEDDVAARARGLIDVLLYDIAVHQLTGNMGSTHGRSYAKDKTRAVDQDLHDVIELAFDTSEIGWSGRVEFTAVLLASATRYRVPLALVAVARDPATIVDRQRMGVALNPAEPVSDKPTPPDGAPGYDDLPFWWERGAWASWQVLDTSQAAVEKHRLDRLDFFTPYQALLLQGRFDSRGSRALAQRLQCPLNANLLGRVDTLTYRSAAAMLSSAQDYRARCYGVQYHAWQATLDENAVVFTTHPGNEPGSFDDRDLYWTGAVTMPRVAQQGPALIAIYRPGFPSSPPGELGAYRPYTHAWFPTEHFDEVRRLGNWTFGRRGDGYVALWSWRAVTWRDPAPNPMGLTKPYDLVAAGGADNVWVSQVGDAATYGSFAAFMDEVGAASPVVEDGYRVRYGAPHVGELAFAAKGPFTVDGHEASLRFDARVENPYSNVAWGSAAWTIRAGGYRLTLDLTTGARNASADARPR